jgi:hypothetical protein
MCSIGWDTRLYSRRVESVHATDTGSKPGRHHGNATLSTWHKVPNCCWRQKLVWKQVKAIDGTISQGSDALNLWAGLLFILAERRGVACQTEIISLKADYGNRRSRARWPSAFKDRSRIRSRIFCANGSKSLCFFKKVGIGRLKL